MITRKVKKEFDVPLDAEIRDYLEAFNALGPRISDYVKDNKLSNASISDIRKYCYSYNKKGHRLIAEDLTEKLDSYLN